jgi:hypothetical protein
MYRHKVTNFGLDLTLSGSISGLLTMAPGLDATSAAKVIW